MKRRLFLGSTVAAAAASIVGTTGLFRQTVVHAAEWPRQAFRARTESEVVKALFDNAAILRDSIQVRLTVPRQLNGEIVRVRVETDLPDVDAIALVTGNNALPLNTIVLMKSCRGYYSTLIRVTTPSPITAYVRAAGKVHSRSAFVKHTSGGYGMNL